MDWVGGSYIMQTRRLQGEVGTPFFKGFFELHGGMAVATKTDLVMYDGQQSTSLTSGRLRRIVAEILSGQFASKTQVYVHAASSTLWLCIPSSEANGALRSAYILDLNKNTWGQKTFGSFYGLGSIKIKSSEKFIWDELGSAVVPEPTSGWIPGLPWDQQTGGTWDEQVFDSSSSDLIAYEGQDPGGIIPLGSWFVTAINNTVVTDPNDNPIYTKIERVGIPIEGSDGVAAVTDIWLDMVSDMPMNLSICGMDTLNSAPTWSGPFTINGPYSSILDNHVDVRATGRYIGYRLETVGFAGYFRFNSLTVDWEHDGER
jgi:hypothetical protein